MKQLYINQTKFLWPVVRADIIKQGVTKVTPEANGMQRVWFVLPAQDASGEPMELCYIVLVKNAQVVDVFTSHLRNGKRPTQRCVRGGDAYTVLSRLAVYATQEKPK